MNPRHAAALALVGWYLMVPPSVATLPDSSRVSIQSMGKEWRILTRTDNAEECAHLLQFALTHIPSRWAKLVQLCIVAACAFGKMIRASKEFQKRGDRVQLAIMKPRHVAALVA